MATEGSLYPPKTFQALEALVQHGLVVDPWMAAIRLPDHVESANARALIDTATARLVAGPLDTAQLGLIPANRQYVANALRETLLSSVAFEAHLESGRVELPPALIHQMTLRLESYVRAVGLSGMLLAYAVTAGAENLAAVQYYRGMRESDFVSGRLHRPWISRELDYELTLGLAAGTLKLVRRNDDRYVLITPKGRATFQDALRLWAATGYTRTRNRMLAIAAYNEMADWDELSDGVVPDLRDLRSHFVREAVVRPGETVLEIGSGTGLLTFDAGLADAVGPTGAVIGLDPSVGMTARAQKKQRERGLGHVRFVQGVAEAMPFADASIDHIVSFAVLQYTRRDQAVKEIARVLKPGGRFSLAVGLKQMLFDEPSYRKWFAPLHKTGRPNDTFCATEEIMSLVRREGLVVERVLYRSGTICLTDPVRVVRTILQFPFYQDVLLAMPYAARMQVAQDLVGRGRFLLDRGAIATNLPTPMEWVFGRKPGPSAGFFAH